MDKRFWSQKDGCHLTDTEMLNNKRPHHWLTDAVEPEVSCHKKQAVQVPVSRPTSGPDMTGALPWESPSSGESMPSQFFDRLFGSNISMSVNLTGQDISPLGTENSSMRKQIIDDQFGNASDGFSLIYPLEDTEACVGYGGIREVKVNQVKDAENSLQSVMEHTMGMPLCPAYIQATEPAFCNTGQAYPKEDQNMAFMDHSDNRVEANSGSDKSTLEKVIENAASPGLSKVGSNSVSLGSYPEESYVDSRVRSGSSYNFFCNQSTLEITETQNAKIVDAQSKTAVTRASPSFNSKQETSSKGSSDTKVARKEAPNSFPSNVRSLISTGILDGVPVRYVSVSREELRGVIKGSGYLCGCQSCNYSKALNAYEFERHAGFKTKHPNNHIFFENGKTIYQVVQELRSISGSQLFDAIQTVTGSPVNQKAFRIWKESFQAATRELERIYGKEELNV